MPCDFAAAEARWGRVGEPYGRRMTEFTGYCPHHYVGFTGFHVRTSDSGERIFECSYCGCEFPEGAGMECDPR